MALLGTNFDEETHKKFRQSSKGMGKPSLVITEDHHAKVIRFNVEAVKLQIQLWINDPKCTGKFTGIQELQEAADSKDVDGKLLLRKGQMIFEEVTVSHAEGQDGTFNGWIYDTFAPLLTLAKTGQSRKFAYFHVAIYVGTYLGQHYVKPTKGSHLYPQNLDFSCTLIIGWETLQRIMLESSLIVVGPRNSKTAASAGQKAKPSLTKFYMEIRNRRGPFKV